MINGIIEWSLHNRLAVIVASTLLLLCGSFVAQTMPIDVFPDLSAPTVTVLVEGHGMVPEELETLVTFPIETAVNGAANVRRVRSVTGVGIAVVWVEFQWGTDIYRARQTVTERLGTVSGNLPPQVDPPRLAPVSSIMGEILFISLTSDVHSSLELRTVAETQLRRRVLSVPGVSQVTAIGGDRKQYQVRLSADKLRAFDVGLREVEEALRQTNENVSAGIIHEHRQEYLVQGIGRIQKPSDIGETVVVVRDKMPITVSDLGTIRVGALIKRGTAASSRRDERWKPITEKGVVIAIQKQPGANTLELTKRLDATLGDIQGSLPEGMLINKSLFRQADFIRTSVDNTVEALRDGAIMVIIVVVIFLASWKASFVTLLAIPLSLVVAILVLKVFGASINTMTLGGMTIAIGSLVDDAIIDVENVVRRLRENAALAVSERKHALTVIYEASVEVRASIVFATFIIILVFLPLFFLSGVEGRLLRPLGTAYCVALAASLITALTLTPALCYYLLAKDTEGAEEEQEPWIVSRFKAWYAPTLRFALRAPKLVLYPTLAAFFLSLGGSIFLGRSFLPEFNEGALVVGVVTLPGTSLEESDKLAERVQRALMEHPEIAAIGRRTGRAKEDEHVQGVEASEIDLTLDMEAPVRVGLPRRSKEELLTAVREDLSAIPGVQATFGQPISHRIDHMLSGTRANIAVKVYGPELQHLRNLAKQVESVMQEIPGVVDLSTEQQALVPQIRVEFKRPTIARYGLRIEQVAQTLQTAIIGLSVSEVFEGQNSFDLAMYVGDPSELSVDEIGEILVDTPDGVKIPLKVLARITRETMPNFISRENGQRKIVVMCNVSGGDLTGVVESIRQALSEQVQFPQDYYVEFGGQFESAQETARLLCILGVMVVFGIGFLLHIVFGSVRDALLTMVNLPLALIGGVVGVFVSGGVLSVASLIGFITVFGVAARNGIMMVSHIQHLQDYEGVEEFYQAVFRGAMERLAPILMTALSAGFALIPLALGANEAGKEILSPMAIVILFGLISSTFLNMIVVPALYIWLGRPRKRDSV